MNNIYRIKSLSLRGFKCYGVDQTRVLRFGSQLTVLIGQNGAGKTSLLNALKKSLSIVLTRDKRPNIEFVGDGQNIKQNTLKAADATYRFEFGWNQQDPNYKIELGCDGIINGEDVSWAIIKDGKGKDSQMPFREALDKFLYPYNNNPENTYLPLLCYFSDSFPHARNDMSNYEKDNLDYNREEIERRAGYYRWDEDNTDFYFWEGLFVKASQKLNDFTSGLAATDGRLAQDKLSKEERSSLMKQKDYLSLLKYEVDYVSHYLKAFSQTLETHDNENMALSGVSVGTRTYGSKREDVLRLHFTNGTFRYFDMLPEGYKRLFSIVFEVAYRYFLLNRKQILANMKHEEVFDWTNESPKGIAIVDELELHLHPTLIQEIVIRLQHTFPHVQLIVSTHSPAVVGNVYNDEEYCRVVRLTEDHNFEDVDNCFGADYSDTLVRDMGSYGKMHLLQLYRELYREYKMYKDADGVNEVVKDIKKLFSAMSNVDGIVDETLQAWELDDEQ